MGAYLWITVEVNNISSLCEYDIVLLKDNSVPWMMKA